MWDHNVVIVPDYERLYKKMRNENPKRQLQINLEIKQNETCLSTAQKNNLIDPTWMQHMHNYTNNPKCQNMIERGELNCIALSQALRTHSYFLSQDHAPTIKPKNVHFEEIVSHFTPFKAITSYQAIITKRQDSNYHCFGLPVAPPQKSHNTKKGKSRRTAPSIGAWTNLSKVIKTGDCKLIWIHTQRGTWNGSKKIVVINYVGKMWMKYI